MGRDHQALACPRVRGVDDRLRRKGAGADEKPVAESGDPVVLVGNHLLPEGLFIIRAAQVPVHQFLEPEQVVIEVKEHEEVRLFRRSNLHAAQDQKAVPFSRPLHGQNVFGRVVVAHADQVQALFQGRADDAPGDISRPAQGDRQVCM